MLPQCCHFSAPVAERAVLTRVELSPAHSSQEYEKYKRAYAAYAASPAAAACEVLPLERPTVFAALCNLVPFDSGREFRCERAACKQQVYRVGPGDTTMRIMCPRCKCSYYAHDDVGGAEYHVFYRKNLAAINRSASAETRSIEDRMKTSKRLRPTALEF